MRLLREARGLTQVQVARALGVSFQQLQKYEQGENRVSASRLFEIAHLLGTEIGFFFEGLGAVEASPPGLPRDGAAKLFAQFLSIKDATVRNEIRDLIAALASDRPCEFSATDQMTAPR